MGDEAKEGKRKKNIASVRFPVSALILMCSVKSVTTAFV